MNSKIKKVLIFLSFIGILDIIYLSIPKIYNTTTYCVASESSSCDLVLNSEYSEFFFGIPNAFMGYYFI